ncbi:hypothetical protein WDU94_006828 [Cyamophila willieti]
MAYLESKDFFYFEFFLESITLDSNIADIYACEFNMRTPVKAGISLAGMRPTVIETYQNSKVVLGKHKTEQYMFTYNKGKCLLMALEPSKCLHMLLTTPLNISFDTMNQSVNPPIPYHLGHTSFLINLNLIRECLLNEFIESSYHATTVCPIASSYRKTAGHATLAIALSCLGNSIVTEIQQLNSQSYLHTNKANSSKTKRNSEDATRLENIFNLHVKKVSLDEKEN